MSDDLAARLGKLQAARGAEVIDDAAYQDGLTRLRAQYGAAAVDALLYGSGSPSRHVQNISGNAKIGTNIVGDHHGNITIGALDFSDNKRVITAPGTRTPPAPAPTPTPRPPLPATLSADGVHFTAGHALLIGVGSYEHWGLDAPNTAADAQHLAALLKDAQIAAYPAPQVTVVSATAATHAGILAALDAFASQLATATAPTAVVFFAGHGKQTDTGYYLLPHDYNAARIGETAISAATFHAKIAAIRQHAQKLVVLLNCCHAGGVGDDVLNAEPVDESITPPPRDFFAPLVAGSGQIVISSSKAGQKSGARSTVNANLTVFGAQLAAALEGSAPGGDAGIGVLDLFAYLSAHVPQDAAGLIYQHAPLAQHPLLYAHQVDQNFALALRPGWQGGTLDADHADLVTQLATLEIQLTAYDSEANAPAVLTKQRDELLRQLGG